MCVSVSPATANTLGCGLYFEQRSCSSCLSSIAKCYTFLFIWPNSNFPKSPDWDSFYSAPALLSSDLIQIRQIGRPLQLLYIFGGCLI